MYPTLFGDAGVSLFVGGTIFGDVAVSLFVPGAKIGEIWVDSRSTNFGAEEGKISSANGLVQFCNFMVTSWTNCPPLQMTLHAQCVEIKVYLFVASARSGDVGMLLLLAGAPLVMLECHCRGRCNIW